MIKSIVINNLKKIYNYVLTHSYNYDIFISTKQKAVEPTKNEPPPIKRRQSNMRKFKITAANKKHFESLIKDFRSNGFMLVTYGARLAELETKTEFVIIEF